MAIKTFKEMRAIDVEPYCDKREGRDDKGNKILVPYLNWAKCIDLLHENGAEKVYFIPLTNEKGSSLFLSEELFTDKNEKANRCFEVRVKVVIDDLEFEMQTPVLNGTAVVNYETMNQLRVANAQARAFVKGVAIYTGLGFGLWSEYESKELDDTNKLVKLEDLALIKDQMQELYTSLLRKGLSQDEIAEKCGVTKDTIRAYFSYFDTLTLFAKNLSAVK